jgi:hypothetical protein
MRAAYATTTTLAKRRRGAPAGRPITRMVDTARRIAKTIAHAIAVPPAHPAWSTPDATTQASLLPARQHERLLQQGRLTPPR